jgi:hypothetical protein
MLARTRRSVSASPSGGDFATKESSVPRRAPALYPEEWCSFQVRSSLLPLGPSTQWKESMA